MRNLTLHLAAVLALFGGSTSVVGQDIENGQRLSERWCVECHAIGTPTAKTSRVIPFASIAKKPGIDADTIASFLLMPHASMPNLPLTRKDAHDIAAFIMKMKN
jgi:mono/diheme cytochrome c family protein